MNLRTQPITASNTTPPTVVVISAVGHHGATTIAGVASTPERAAAWLRSPTGRWFLTEYGDPDALREPPEAFMDLLPLDQFGRHLDLISPDL